jgi:hypothetical protein
MWELFDEYCQEVSFQTNVSEVEDGDDPLVE